MSLSQSEVILAFKSSDEENIAVICETLEHAMSFCKMLDKNGIKNLDGENYYCASTLKWMMDRLLSGNSVAFTKNGIWNTSFMTKDEYKQVINYTEITLNKYCIDLI